MVDRIKLARGCVDCGYKRHPTALEFDHVGGVKRSTVNHLAKTGAPWHLIVAEMARCEVVCANCHRIRTAARGSAGWVRKAPVLALPVPGIQLALGLDEPTGQAALW